MAANDQAPTTRVPIAARRVSSAVRGLGKVTLLAIFVQFILAGLGTFDAAHGGRFKDSYFSMHDKFALVIIALTALTAITALVTRSGRTAVTESLLLVLLAAPVQHFLATTGTDHSPWVGSLHVLVGVLILVLDAHLAFPGLGAAFRSRASNADAV